MTTATTTLSATELPKKSVAISGRTMTYSEMGPKDKDADPAGPIVFLHGNPTSSYLWRNVMPHLQAQGRCIAPDLIGMGDSDKLEPSGPERYTFREHRRFLDAFLEQLGIQENVTLVIHDWGSALGFDWANRNRTKVKGIAYMEGIVRPLTWDEWSPSARHIFEGFRSDQGEAMILEKNLFIEAVLPGSIIRKLTPEEMDVYRRPFKEAGEDRRPTLSWPRQIPLDGTPADVVELVQSYADWMAQNEIPKLFINAEPGAILTGAQREFCRSWKNQKEVTVKGIHFLQEDSPHEIGRAISDWLRELT
ncbi:MAG: haloalkane dehalogenase [Parvibaculaceae bacterium]